MANFLISAFSDEYSPNFAEQLDGMKSLGIGYIEPRGIDKNNISTLSDAALFSVRRMLDDASIGISAIGSPIGKITLEDDFDAYMAQYDQILRAAEILGTNRIRMFSFFIPEGEDPRKYRDGVLRRLDVLISRAAKKNILLCHENESRIYGEKLSECVDLMEQFGTDMKFVFDPCNFVQAEVDTWEAYKELKPWIEYLHIKDATAEKAICPAGEGIGHISEILADCNKLDRDIFVTLEPHLRVFDGLNNLSNMDDIVMRYQYNSSKEAFTAAFNALDSIIKSL